MNSRHPIRVLIVDDHLVVRQGLKSMLDATDDIVVIGEASNAPSAIRKAKELTPDVILLDIRLPAGSSGLDVCRALSAQHPDIRTIILTTYEEEDYLFDALKAGAWGYVLKTTSYEDLVEAITSVAGGKRLLSAPMIDKLVAHYSEMAREKVLLESGFDQSELDILKLLAEGATNKEIALRLHWSEISVKRKLQNIFEKLEVGDRTHAAVEAIRRGLI
jgi:DNA-binding NarL/FixJ family response regulator